MSTRRTDADPALARQQHATARHWSSVNDLLEHRRDLHGVHAMADLIYDAVRWSA